MIGGLLLVLVDISGCLVMPKIPRSLILKVLIINSLVAWELHISSEFYEYILEYKYSHCISDMNGLNIFEALILSLSFGLEDNRTVRS